jgi:hypothetical protein
VTDDAAGASPPQRSLRDRPLGRIAMLAVVLGVAFVAARSCADSTPDVSKDEAIRIAEGVAAFSPHELQIRFVQQGAPSPRGIWAVSMYRGNPTRPTLVQLVQIDAETGEILDDGL